MKKMYSLKTNFLRKLLAVMVIAGAVWFSALPAYATIRDVSSIEMLTTEIGNAVTGDEIRLTADITNPNSPYTSESGATRPPQITINGKTITISGKDSNGIVHTLQGYEILVTGASANVTFKNIVLDGNVKRNATYLWTRLHECFEDYFIRVDGSAHIIFDEGTIIKNFKNYSMGAIAVKDNSNITMKEGVEITDCAAKYGVIRVESATFNMEGGEIYDCFSSNYTCDVWAQGVVAYISNSATFNMTGGVIRNNTCALWEGGETALNDNTSYNSGNCYGTIYLHPNGNNKFIMTGGVFETNTANLGGVVYCCKSDDIIQKPNIIQIGGSAQGLTNVGLLSQVSNIYLLQDQVLQISSPFEPGARVGIYTEANPEAGDIKIVTGATAGDQAHFISDKLATAGVIFCDGTHHYDANGGEIGECYHPTPHELGTLWLSTAVAHTHSWNYDLGPDNVLTATCSTISCPYHDGLSVTLLAADAACSGSSYTGASVEGASAFTIATGLSVGNIKYVGREGTTYTENETAPTEEGKYTATVQVGSYTLTKNFFIAPAGSSHIHDDIVFTAWNNTTSLPNSPGSYYLTNDVTLSSTWSVSSGTTNLCLNGKVINTTSGTVISISSGHTLNLYDCDNTAPHEGGVDDNGLWHLNGGGTPTTIYGGVITGGNGGNDGGGVKVSSGGSFNMYGGNIAGCNAGLGGGVLSYGLLSMTGGTIQYCTATYGGGIYAKNSAKFDMSGGSISHCTASRFPGGVMLSGADSSGPTGPTFNFSGGDIVGNIAKTGGGGIFLEKFAPRLNMTGGTIAGNYGNWRGSAIYGNGNDNYITITGGTITGNSINGDGGIFISSSATNPVVIGGTAQITGNVKGGIKGEDGLYTGGTPSNVYLEDNDTRKINITIGTGENAPNGMIVGVTEQKKPSCSEISVQFTTNGGDNEIQYFSSDEGYEMFAEGGHLCFKHIHGNWQYTASENIVTVTCGNNIPGDSPMVSGTLTINATDAFYNGEAHGASWDIMGDLHVDPSTLDIMYEGVSPTEYESVSTAPTNAGTYNATVTVTGEGEGNTATAKAQFTISKVDYSDEFGRTASCTLGASQGSTASFELPIPPGAEYGTVTNEHNFTVAIDGSTVTLTTNTGGLPHNTDPITFTVAVNPDINHNPYDIIVTVTPHPSEINGVRYFYNAAAGKWLGVDNLNNGMKASLVDKPQPIFVTDNGDYTYLLDAYIASSEGNGYLGLVSNECFMNCTEGAAVSFWPVEGGTNAYIIKDIEGNVFGYDGNGSTLLSANAPEENAHWTLRTRADLISGLDGATIEDQRDATFLINDPQFGKDNRLFNEKWQGDALEKAGSDDNTHASVGTPNGTVGKFNAYQDLGEDLPNGVYELSVQGFYTSESGKRCAYFYANNEAMALKNISSIAQQPATEEKASEAFTAGKYQCSTLRFVVINNKIRIGVKGVYGECGWTAFDNFRLTYLGPTSQLNH